MNEKPVGSGPYRVTEHALGKSIALERNPDYFKDCPKAQPKIDKVEIRFIPDRQTQVAEMLSGGVDLIMHVAADQADQLEGGADTCRSSRGETMRIVFLQFNTLENTPAPQLQGHARAPGDHACDRPRGHGQERSSARARACCTRICFPSQFGCTDEGAPRYAYDPAKAKQLLAEAGFPNGFDIDFYAYRERNQTEAMIGYLRAVGIQANLRFMQYAAMREPIRASKAALTHQTWGSFSVNDVSASTPVYFKFERRRHHARPGSARPADKGDNSVDPEVRKEAYKQALTLIAERAYSVPLYSLPVYYVADQGPRLQGLSGRDAALLGDDAGSERQRAPADGRPSDARPSSLEAPRPCASLVALAVSALAFLLLRAVRRSSRSRSPARARAQEDIEHDPRRPTASTGRCWCSTSTGSGSIAARRFRPVALLQDRRRRRWCSASCRRRCCSALLSLAVRARWSRSRSACWRRSIRNSWIDRLCLALAVVGQALPNFFFALLLIMLFSITLRWLPVSGSDTWAHFVMPTIALGYYVAPAFMRLVRAGMIEVLASDYIRTARAKGLSAHAASCSSTRCATRSCRWWRWPRCSSASCSAARW